MAALKWEPIDVSGTPKATIYGNSSYDYGATHLFLRAELPHGWMLWIQPLQKASQFFYIPDPTKSWGRAEKGAGAGGSGMGGTVEALLEAANADGVDG